MRDHTTRQLNRTKIALWSIAAVMIISGISIEREFDRQEREQAEQRIDEAVSARQSAEEARNDAQGDQAARDAENAKLRAENDILRQQLAAQTGAEAEPVVSTPVTGSTSPSVIPRPVTDTITPITNAIDPVINEIMCPTSPLLTVPGVPLLTCYNKASN